MVPVQARCDRTHLFGELSRVVSHHVCTSHQDSTARHRPSRSKVLPGGLAVVQVVSGTRRWCGTQAAAARARICDGREAGARGPCDEGRAGPRAVLQVGLVAKQSHDASKLPASQHGEQPGGSLLRAFSLAEPCHGWRFFLGGQRGIYPPHHSLLAASKAIWQAFSASNMLVPTVPSPQPHKNSLLASCTRYTGQQAVNSLQSDQLN